MAIKLLLTTLIVLLFRLICTCALLIIASQTVQELKLVLVTFLIGNGFPEFGNSGSLDYGRFFRDVSVTDETPVDKPF